MLLVFQIPLQSGDPLVGTTCPYRHVAVFPPRLVYPPGQLSVRVVPCATGSAGSVTTLLHVELAFTQPVIKRMDFAVNFYFLLKFCNNFRRFKESEVRTIGRLVSQNDCSNF